MIDERFRQVEDEYVLLKEELAAGRITQEQLEAKLEESMIEHDGRYWMLGVNSGKWYAHDGNAWVEARPPAALSVAAPLMIGSPRAQSQASAAPVEVPRQPASVVVPPASQPSVGPISATGVGLSPSAERFFRRLRRGGLMMAAVGTLVILSMVGILPLPFLYVIGFSLAKTLLILGIFLFALSSVVPFRSLAPKGFIVGSAVLAVAGFGCVLQDTGGGEFWWWPDLFFAMSLANLAGAELGHLLTRWGPKGLRRGA